MIALDPEAAPLVDPPSVPIRGTGIRTLTAVDGLVLVGGDAWDRLRALRSGNVRAGAVLVITGEPPSDRARLEPVIAIGSLDRTALREALAAVTRVRAAGRVRLAGGVADLDRARFLRDDGQEVALTGLETRLVAYLATRAGRAVERDELQREVWDHAKALPTKTVEMTVARLRKKIEPDPGHPTSILTVRGGGYRAVPVAEEEERPGSAPLGAFVGREALLARLLASLDPRAPLGLYGPPGVGKSRLAAELVRRWTGPAKRVDLYGAGSVSLATALATALGAQAAGDPLDAALEAVRGVELVVLDDADDHLDQLAPLVARAASAGIRLVTTSRQVPTVLGLAVCEVPPLADDDAIALLVDRAGPIADGRALVARLDGLPLAIELAGARLAAMGPAGLAEALAAHGTGWLAAHGHRHGSLGAAIGWSWDRLPQDLQRVLAALAAFRGGFSLDDAAAVADAAPLDVAALAERSLVARDGDRFRLLHAVRDHAAAQAPAAAAAGVERFVDRMRGLGVIRSRELSGFEARAAYGALAAAATELRHALDLAAEPGAVADLVLALDRLRAHAGTEAERVALLEEGLERTRSHPARGRLLLRRASMWGTHDPARTLAALREARDAAPDDLDLLDQSRLVEAKVLHWTAGPRASLACLDLIHPHRDPVRALCAEVERVNGRIQLGEVGVVEGCELIEGLVDELVAEGALVEAATMVLQATGRWVQWAPGRALPLLERFATWAEAAHDQRLRLQLLLALAGEQAAVGASARAHQAMDQAEALAERVQPSRVNQVKSRRADLLIAEGRWDEARPLVQRAAAWWRRRESATGEFGALEAWATLECDAGRPEAALRPAEQAVDAGRRSANPHILHHAHLLQLQVAVLAGDHGLASAALAATDPRHLSELGRLQYRCTRSAFAAATGRADREGWAQLEAELAPRAGPAWLARAAALVDAWRSGAPGALAASADPARERTPELRVLARIWRVAIRRVAPRTQPPADAALSS